MKNFENESRKVIASLFAEIVTKQMAVIVEEFSKAACRWLTEGGFETRLVGEARVVAYEKALRLAVFPMLEEGFAADLDLMLIAQDIVKWALDHDHEVTPALISKEIMRRFYFELELLGA
jgi:hypothetical protein